MAEAVFCGVDIGTTHVKAVLLDERGRLVTVARARTPVTADDYGPCHDPEALRSTVEGLMVDAQRKADVVTRVEAIGITSVGEEGVPVDAAGVVLYPAIAWYDRRPSPAADDWSRRHSADELHELSGLHADLGFTLFKWLWLQSFRPDVWKRCARWLGVGDYVAWRWTGGSAMSMSHASRTCVFDLRAFRWHAAWADEALAAGVATLPPLLHAGGIVGTLAQGAVPGLAVGRDVPVVATGLDHTVGCYAAGIRRPGDVMDSLGTAEGIVVPAAAIPGLPVWKGARADFGAGLEPGALIGLAALASGAGLHSLRVELGAETAAGAAELERAAAGVPPGAHGLRYVPSRIRDSGRGTWIGEAATAADRYRAALEGWTMAAADAIDALPAPDVGDRDVASTGGGTQSTLWVRIKASVLGRPVRVVRTPELVGAGAALFGAAAAGAAALQTEWKPADVDTIDPDPAWVERYREQRNEFHRLAEDVYHGEVAPLYP